MRSLLSLLAYVDMLVACETFLGFQLMSHLEFS